MNKTIFRIKFKNHEYKECVNILRKELITNIENKIKQKDSYFSYSTTYDLYKKSKQVLDYKNSKIAYKLYYSDIMNDSPKLVLDEMFEMYQELNNI